jgi:hypothetical protein
MFKLIGVYQGQKETIDEFETREEAEKMLTEYRIAYGAGWNIFIKKS